MNKLDNLLTEINNTRVEEPNMFQLFMLSLLVNSYSEDLKTVAKRLHKHEIKEEHHTNVPKSKLLALTLIPW